MCEKLEDELTIYDVYNEVFGVVEYFLNQAFPLISLKSLENLDKPDLDELIRMFNIGYNMIHHLADDNSYANEDMKANALQCTIIMERIAKAVKDENFDETEKLVKNLKQLSMNPVPYDNY